MFVPAAAGLLDINGNSSFLNKKVLECGCYVTWFCIRWFGKVLRKEGSVWIVYFDEEGIIALLGYLNKFYPIKQSVEIGQR